MFFFSPNVVLPAAPCTISMAISRSLRADAASFAHAVPAGAIASRNGSAIVAPRPFRTVRAMQVSFA